MENLPEPISRQDELLHNIADGTPDISDLEPISREEEYLKYIALNGTGGGGGGDITLPVSISNGGTGATNSTNARNNLDIYSKSEVDKKISDNKVQIEQGVGTNTTSVMSQKAVSDEFNKLGTAAVCNTGLFSGNVPVLNSNNKLDNSIIPPLAKVDTFNANSYDAMVMLSGADQGDICRRTDENKTYIKSDSSTWLELLNPVSSVQDKTGNVFLEPKDINTYSKLEIDDKIPNIVQSTGDSNSSIMSQSAVTHMYDDVVIGSNTSAANLNCTVLGNDSSTTANAHNSIALGSYSIADDDGVLSIGSGEDNIYFGRRRIVNVTDPVNIHDAATKNYVDTKLNLKVDKIEGKELTSNDFTDNYKNKVDSIDNLIKSIVLNEDKTIYISSTGSDTSGDGTQSLPFATISHAISILPKIINSTVVINISAGEFELNNSDISGFSGSGTLAISGAGSGSNISNATVINNKLYIKNNSISHIQISSCRFILSNDPEDNDGINNNISFVDIVHCAFLGTTSNNASIMIYIINSSFVKLYDCAYNYTTNPIYIDGGSRAIINKMSATNATTAISVNNGSICSITQSISGVQTITKSNGGCIIYPNGTFSE